MTRSCGRRRREALRGAREGSQEAGALGVTRLFVGVVAGAYAYDLYGNVTGHTDGHTDGHPGDRPQPVHNRAQCKADRTVGSAGLTTLGIPHRGVILGM